VLAVRERVAILPSGLPVLKKNGVGVAAAGNEMETHSRAAATGVTVIEWFICCFPLVQSDCSQRAAGLLCDPEVGSALGTVRVSLGTRCLPRRCRTSGTQQDPGQTIYLIDPTQKLPTTMKQNATGCKKTRLSAFSLHSTLVMLGL
jgi:hypothetical protein